MATNIRIPRNVGYCLVSVRCELPRRDHAPAIYSVASDSILDW